MATLGKGNSVEEYRGKGRISVSLSYIPINDYTYYVFIHLCIIHIFITK